MVIQTEWTHEFISLQRSEPKVLVVSEQTSEEPSNIDRRMIDAGRPEVDQTSDRLASMRVAYARFGPEDTVFLQIAKADLKRSWRLSGFDLKQSLNSRQ